MRRAPRRRHGALRRRRPSILDRLWQLPAAQAPGWQSIALRLPARGTIVSASIVDGRSWNQFARSTLTVDAAAGRVVAWEPYDAMSAGQKLRPVFRFTHTGEIAGWPGQLIAGVASAGGALLVWTGIALAVHRLFGWRSWPARRRGRETAAADPDLFTGSVRRRAATPDDGRSVESGQHVDVVADVARQRRQVVGDCVRQSARQHPPHQRFLRLERIVVGRPARGAWIPEHRQMEPVRRYSRRASGSRCSCATRAVPPSGRRSAASVTTGFGRGAAMAGRADNAAMTARRSRRGPAPAGEGPRLRAPSTRRRRDDRHGDRHRIDRQIEHLDRQIRRRRAAALRGNVERRGLQGDRGDQQGNVQVRRRNALATSPAAAARRQNGHGTTARSARSRTRRFRRCENHRRDGAVHRDVSPPSATDRRNLPCASPIGTSLCAITTIARTSSAGRSRPATPGIRRPRAAPHQRAGRPDGSLIPDHDRPTRPRRRKAPTPPARDTTAR